MLDTIRQCIKELPSESFEVMYQRYVKDVQDKIIDHDICLANHSYKSIEDINQLVVGLNILTEELKSQ